LGKRMALSPLMLGEVLGRREAAQLLRAL